MCARRSERGAVCIYSPGAADDRESQGEASPDGEPSLGGISLVLTIMQDHTNHPMMCTLCWNHEILNLKC